MNLEYLGRVVFNSGGFLYPDSLVGTDSHTTMIDGLGVAGWGVGGIEAEAVMLGQVDPFWRFLQFGEQSHRAFLRSISSEYIVLTFLGFKCGAANEYGVATRGRL